MAVYSVLNRSLDIWIKRNVTKQEAIELFVELYSKEMKKAENDWHYEYEIVKA